MSTFQILLSRPQIICWIRLLAICLAFALFNQMPLISIVFVIIGECLDVVDGYIARKYDLATDFGAIADMLIDRLTPLFCFIALIVLDQKHVVLYSFILAADLLGHMTMLYGAILKPTITHHKAFFRYSNPLLELYYADKGLKRLFMFFCIFFYDLALISWIIFFISPSYLSASFLLPVTVLGFVKVIIHIMHIYYGFKLSIPVVNEEGLNKKET